MVDLAKSLYISISSKQTKRQVGTEIIQVVPKPQNYYSTDHKTKIIWENRHKIINKLATLFRVILKAVSILYKF